MGSIPIAISKCSASAKRLCPCKGLGTGWMCIEGFARPIKALSLKGRTHGLIMLFLWRIDQAFRAHSMLWSKQEVHWQANIVSLFNNCDIGIYTWMD